MERLFVKALEAIYEAALEPGRWPQALQAIADTFGDVGTTMLYLRDDGGFGVVVSPSLDAIAAEYSRSWTHRDIRAIRANERGFFFSHDVCTDRFVLTPKDMETDPFYTDLLARYGLKYFAATAVSPDPHVGVAISIQRAADKPEYSEEELEIVKQFGPHVERALRLGIRLLDTELANVGLGAALSRVGMGVFVLDSLGRVVFSNDAAQGLIGDGLELVDERLTVRNTIERGGAQEPIKEVIAGLPETLDATPKPMLIHRRNSNRPLALYLLPITASVSRMHSFLTHARAVVLVVDPDADEPPDPALIRDFMGLTLGEARVASLVGSGVPPRDAAAKLGIAEETARSVLKRVFTKVGVSSQSELAALMTKLVLK